MQNNPAGKTGLGLDSNLAGLLCYILTPCCLIGVILGLILFFTEKDNRFARFHALQSLLVAGVFIALGMVFTVLGRLLLAADEGIMFFGLLGVRLLIFLVFLAIWIYAGIQAYQNKWTKLPILGDLAEKWSNS
ncbi:DUF4870 domain-containing protein [soil metagenome]